MKEYFNNLFNSGKKIDERHIKQFISRMENFRNKTVTLLEEAFIQEGINQANRILKEREKSGSVVLDF